MLVTQMEMDFNTLQNKSVIDSVREILSTLNDEGMVDATALWVLYGAVSKDRIAYFTDTQMCRKICEELLKDGISSFRTTKGRYGGTYMHPALAFEYVRWMDSSVAVEHNAMGYAVATQQATVLPTDYLSALKALVASEEQKQILQIEAEHLRKTKAHISDSKTASAMGKAGAAVKKANKLEKELQVLKDESTDFATTIAVELVTKGKYSGLKLSNCARKNEEEIKVIPDERFGKIHSYTRRTWLLAYGIDIKLVCA